MKKCYLLLVFILILIISTKYEKAFAQEFIYYHADEMLLEEQDGIVESVQELYFECLRLVAIVYNDNYKTVITDEDIGDIEINSDLNLDNDLKANNWIYIFKSCGAPVEDYVAVSRTKYFYEIDDATATKIITTYTPDIEDILPDDFKITFDGSISIVAIANGEFINDSTFISILKQNSSFMELISDVDKLKNYTISLQHYDEPTYGMEANELYWVSIVESGDSVYVCHINARDPDRVLYCNNYVGIEETKLITNLVVSPNPASNDVTLSLNLENSGDLKIILTDLLGKELFEIYNEFTNTGNFNKIFSITDLPQGTYFVKIIHNNDVLIEKIIKK